MSEEAKHPLPPVLILFGAPGSGKGTQARILEERFHWLHISTGDMLRKHIEAGDDIGKQVEQLMRAGKLVTDDLVNTFVEGRLAETDCRAGVILDGYPRTVNQAAALLTIARHLGYLPAVIHLVVDDATIVARLSGRRQCPVCGTLYSNQTHPPKKPGICDNDGTPLIKREDDRASVIRERLGQYELQTRPLLQYFREAGLPVIETEGATRSPQAILQEISAELLAANVLLPESVADINVAK